MDDKTRRNLIDAGCDDKFIEKYDCCCDKKACEKLLLQHRKQLLDEIHVKEKNIGCLDYLVYTINKQEAKKRN